MSEETKTEKKPTPAGQWSNEGETELPSGNRVRFHRAMLYVWLKTGQLDRKTEETVRAIVSGKDEDVEFEERQEAMNVLLCRCVTEPHWSIEPREGAVWVDDVCDTDRRFLAMLLDVSL